MFAGDCRQKVGKPGLPYVGRPSLKLFLNPELWPPVAGLQLRIQYCTLGRKQTNWLQASLLPWLGEVSQARLWQFVIDDMCVPQDQIAVSPEIFQDKGCGAYLEHPQSLLMKEQVATVAEDSVGTFVL